MIAAVYLNSMNKWKIYKDFPRSKYFFLDNLLVPTADQEV